MSKKKTASNSGKRKQAEGSAPNTDSHHAAGGELHQIAGGEHPALTTNQGVALSDNQNSLRANRRGPTLLEDFILREKLTHFDHERIPERIVYARATGAHGFFELTASLKQYTTARILTEVGEKTPVFTRISVSYTHLRAHETRHDLVCRLLLEKKKKKQNKNANYIIKKNKMKKQINKKRNT